MGSCRAPDLAIVHLLLKMAAHKLVEPFQQDVAMIRLYRTMKQSGKTSKASFSSNNGFTACSIEGSTPHTAGCLGCAADVDLKGDTSCTVNAALDLYLLGTYQMNI